MKVDTCSVNDNVVNTSIVELEQFLACFRVARVCQRQLGFLVFSRVLYNKNHVLHSLLPERNDHGYVLRRRRHERAWAILTSNDDKRIA